MSINIQVNISIKKIEKLSTNSLLSMACTNESFYEYLILIHDLCHYNEVPKVLPDKGRHKPKAHSTSFPELGNTFPKK